MSVSTSFAVYFRWLSIRLAIEIVAGVVVQITFILLEYL